MYFGTIASKTDSGDGSYTGSSLTFDFSLPSVSFPLRTEKMPFLDRMMMKAFRSMMKRKKAKTEADRQMAQAIAGSYDISSKEYIVPLIAALK